MQHSLTLRCLAVLRTLVFSPLRPRFPSISISFSSAGTNRDHPYLAYPKSGRLVLFPYIALGRPGGRLAGIVGAARANQRLAHQDHCGSSGSDTGKGICLARMRSPACKYVLYIHTYLHYTHVRIGR
ncbi:hypothetical protein F5B20DRAFT_101309 [Whalleya microplaca]|nr:hypothetical protein F5B20DRAFT_101309 [Whalleya microplaca]